MIEIQFNMKNSILLAFLATDFCSGLQLFRLDNTFLLAFIAPSNFLTETISMRVTHITGPAHNVGGVSQGSNFSWAIYDQTSGHTGY